MTTSMAFAAATTVAMAVATAMATAIAMAMAMATASAMAMATAVATPAGKGSDNSDISSTYFQIIPNVDLVSWECSHPPYKEAWLTKLINPYCCDHHDQ